MSTKQNETDDQDLLVTCIKAENNTDGDSMLDKSIPEINEKKNNCANLLSTSTTVRSPVQPAYKGKIEVTSKGRRKIFDGVRWQILCRRPECRKQTNKKSLCITHYKEEYESNVKASSSSPWLNNRSSFNVTSYRHRNSLDNKQQIRVDNEDQNNTITTTNLIDSDEQLFLNSTKTYMLHDGRVECTSNGRRFILRNSKWLPLCKFDNRCYNVAKYDLLCVKHFELQQTRREMLQFHTVHNRRSCTSIFDEHHSSSANEMTKRLKTNNDFQTSSSCLMEQFSINNHEHNYVRHRPVDTDYLSSTSKTVSKKNFHGPSSSHVSFNKQSFEQKIDKSVQTDLTMPSCCMLRYENHLLHSSCQNHKLVSSMLFHDAKSEPKSF